MRRTEKPPPTAIRAAPLQGRSRERYERILAATHAEIGETGLDALNMYAIARRARITPTSIYRYFESVEQILVTTASLSFTELEAKIGQLFASAHSTDEWIEAFAASTRAAWRSFSTSPVGRGLFGASKFLPQLRAIDDAFNRRVFESMMRRLQELSPGAATPSARRLLTLLIGLSTPTFDLAIRQPRNARSAVVEEFIAIATDRLRENLRA
ncbi:MAG: TetR/AcrR family transcriptional regulator [Deltaproteobacteria bacterium]|nr:TetR/AcrR family transcriptional regulator [Deltaproteobacteria bacterium]